MSAILTVTGWLSQTFLAALVQKAGDFAIERWFKVEDRDGDGKSLKKLKKTLLAIQPIIGKVENMWIEDEMLKQNVNELLMQLKDAAYDADDLLDEIRYYDMRQQIEQRGDEASNLSSSSSRVPHRKRRKTSFSSAARSIFGKWDGKDDDVIKAIKETEERLDSIATEVKETIAWVEVNGRGKELKLSTVSRKTSSFVETQLFGRETELEELGGLLSKLEAGSNNNGSFSVVTIVGIGGVGKTTLVQEAYNNKIVGVCFDCKLWVCVSENFSEERLSREMIESKTGKKCDLVNFDTLQSTIKEIINSKRFLLVLDDVWDLDRRKWERFCAPFKFGALGSKVLITTRFNYIAIIVGSANLINLDGLDEKSLWEYFEKCIFVSQNFGDYPELEAIAKRNIHKLKGLPLAARTLGRLLNQSMDRRHWEPVMESEIWKLPQKETDVLPALQLSYQCLPTHLKRCFAFCSLFPKDFKFEETNLIEFWMAEGFVAPQGNMRMEDIGSIYFRELVDRSFFQQSQYKGMYVIHDLLHDLAELISRGECYRIEGTKQHEIPSMIRHISMFDTNFQELNSYNKLRTIISSSNQQEPILLISTMFERLKSINVLDLQFCPFHELPETIGNLVHLRYIHISLDFIPVNLPESLCNLFNLQSLIFKLCHPQQRLPHGMSKLINLRHLVASNETILRISEIGKLTSLQELPVFKVLNKHGRKIEELNHLTQLRGMLQIQKLENIASAEEARRAKLNNKKYLEALKLKWESPCGTMKLGKQVIPCDTTKLGKHQLIDLEEILEALQPHQDLKHLTIKGYMGARSPSWLRADVLCSLESLALVICKNWEDLSYIVQLPHLKVLRIEGNLTIKQIRHQFLHMLQELHLKDLSALEELPYIGQLPNLKVIHMENLPALRYFGYPIYGPTEGKFFPALQKLVLHDLMALEEIHNLGQLSCLSTLDLHNMPSLQYIPNLGQLPCLMYLHIREIPKLKMIGHGFFGADKSKCFPCLKELSIRDMPAWEEWSGPKDQDLFPSLHTLSMYSCPKLKGLPPISYSLEKLSLSEVGLIELPRLCREIESNSSTITACLSSLRITRCPNLTSLEEGLLMHHLPSIKSIQISQCEELMRLPVDTFKELTSLDVLAISGCPKLMIQDEKFVFLPPSIKDLSLHGSCDLNKFQPSCLHSLSSSLTQLSIADYPYLVSLPRLFLDLKKLVSLRIGDCTELKSIEGLGNLESLESLTIVRCPKLVIQNEKLDFPPPSIKHLTLDGPVSLPRLILDLKKLVSLSIVNCSELKSVYGLGNLKSVESLTIERCPKLMIQNEKLDFLPPSIKDLILHDLVSLPRLFLDLKKLVRLSIVNCSELKSIEGLGNLECLESLTIKGCPKLPLKKKKKRCPKLLPDGGNKHEESLSSRIRLEIDDTTLLKLPSIRKTLPSILELNISFSSEAVVLDGEDQELLRSLTALKVLRFACCGNLQFLPRKLHTLSFLESLEVIHCPQVKSLPETGLPTSLSDLFVVGNCHPMLLEQSYEYYLKMME